MEHAAQGRAVQGSSTGTSSGAAALDGSSSKDRSRHWHYDLPTHKGLHAKVHQELCGHKVPILRVHRIPDGSRELVPRVQHQGVHAALRGRRPRRVDGGGLPRKAAKAGGGLVAVALGAEIHVRGVKPATVGQSSSWPNV